MILKKDVENYLEQLEAFRERKHKDAGLANLLMRRYKVLQSLSRETVIAIVQDYTSMDRVWRQILEQRPELRGKDYDEKVALEENKQAELGYNVGQKPLIG